MPTVRALLPILALAGTLPVTPVLAAPECLANGKIFQLGQNACLTVAGKTYLARCEVVQNNTSWVKVSDACPASANDQGSDRTPPADQDAN